MLCVRCVLVCVPVCESHLKSRAVGLKSVQCETDLFGLSLPSLQSCSQTFIFGPQPFNAPETMREGMRSVKDEMCDISKAKCPKKTRPLLSCVFTLFEICTRMKEMVTVFACY